VVPPEDSIALADAIAALADDPERRQLMGKHGRSHMERYFDRAELAREYRKIIEAAGGRR
jgi:glycosyltransferase involved in cell wall biosynthesis